MTSIHLFPAKAKKLPLIPIPDISAPCPDRFEESVRLEISKSTVEKLVTARRRTDIFQAWAHLVGEMPPVNNAELVRRTEHSNDIIATISDAHACFRGVHRRYDQDDNGFDVYVYIIKTAYTVRMQASMRTAAGIYPAPDGTLFTVLVRPSAALQTCQEGIWGTVAKWEFINACREHPDFPEGFGERYDELVWHR